MNKIVLFDFDGDSAIHHPVTKLHIINNTGVIAFNVTNQSRFINDLLNNNFNLDEKVYSAIIHFTEFYEGYDLLQLLDGVYTFGNYTISVISNIIEV